MIFGVLGGTAGVMALLLPDTSTKTVEQAEAWDED